MEEILTEAIGTDEGTNDTSAIGEIAEQTLGAMTDGNAEDGVADEPADEPATELGTDIGDEDFARQAEEDLAVLSRHFPSLLPDGLASLRHPGRYGELREAGLSPVEAFCASHHELILSGGRGDNRAHLGSCIPRGASLAAGQLGARELEEARELFPSLSDGEIEALYRRVEKRGHNKK